MPPPHHHTRQQDPARLLLRPSRCGDALSRQVACGRAQAQLWNLITDERPTVMNRRGRKLTRDEAAIRKRQLRRDFAGLHRRGQTARFKQSRVESACKSAAAPSATSAAVGQFGSALTRSSAFWARSSESVLRRKLRSPQHQQRLFFRRVFFRPSQCTQSIAATTSALDDDRDPATRTASARAASRCRSCVSPPARRESARPHRTALAPSPKFARDEAPQRRKRRNPTNQFIGRQRRWNIAFDKQPVGQKQHRSVRHLPSSDHADRRQNQSCCPGLRN